MQVNNVNIVNNNYCFSAKGGGICFAEGDTVFDNIDFDEGKYLNFCLENKEQIMEIVNLCFWTKETQEPELRITIGIFPEIKTPVSIPVEVLKGNELYLKRVAPVFKRTVKGHGVAPEDIIKFGFIMSEGDRDRCVEISDIHTSDYPNEITKTQESIVDELGQYANGNWHGKTENAEQLKSRIKAELESIKEYKADIGDDFYKVIYENGRYLFSDGHGKKVFLSSVDCIVPSEKSTITGFENFYKKIPEDKFCKTEFTNKGQLVKTASFILSNLSKAVGNEDVKKKWMKITNDRINKLGFNSIGAWSDKDFIKYSNLPYTVVLDGFPTTKENVYRDFPDVFSPEYYDNAEKYAVQIIEYKDDKRLIGYFMRNEPHWAFVDNINLGLELFKNKNCKYTREKFIEWIKTRYSDIELLNKKFTISVKRYEDIFEISAEEIGEELTEELFEFSKLMVEEYVRVPAQALKKLDEKHLNLGLRYAYISSEALYSGAEYMDVFSINCYNYTCTYDVEKIYKNTNKPIMIGEYHYGALDRGLPSTGIKGVKSQEDRKKAVRYYLEQAAACPYCVGVQYFQLNDQGIMGRPDGENYQIGIQDICLRVYEEIAEGFSEAHKSINDIIKFNKKPTEEKPEAIAAIF